MFQTFSTRRQQVRTLKKIEQINGIIAEFQEQGYTLTIRQLFYQLVARGLRPNLLKEYQLVGALLTNGRRAGLIDWASIEDRGRFLRTLSSWSDPSEIIRDSAASYREDVWAGQRYRPEVWIEKDALVGVIEGVCDEYRIPYFACRGFSSITELYAAGRRFRDYFDRGQTPIVLYLGDHDPSGLVMPESIQKALSEYAEEAVEVRRLGLNIEQVRQYAPPANFAKEKDTRSAGYVEQYGAECWELDALSPAVITELIRAEVDSLIDPDSWNAAMIAEQSNRDELSRLAAQF